MMSGQNALPNREREHRIPNTEGSFRLPNRIGTISTHPWNASQRPNTDTFTAFVNFSSVLLSMPALVNKVTNYAFDGHCWPVLLLQSQRYYVSFLVAYPCGHFWCQKSTDTHPILRVFPLFRRPLSSAVRRQSDAREMETTAPRCADGNWHEQQRRRRSIVRFNEPLDVSLLGIIAVANRICSLIVVQFSSNGRTFSSSHVCLGLRPTFV